MEGKASREFILIVILFILLIIIGCSCL
ncbi:MULTISPECIES: YjcZ family sporulation protein [unclassified Bacillus (in: firmicutes)]|nr:MULTISPECIES: YjcZ family sporulation protein [unclassified Bacillus (in: firmicutes)]PEJ60735.1 hypothetical protein CN692_01195 [Bacillus sp. AFS002410]PEL09758.1 hypothetical protein CN601_14525 [Bacillus sp. AFS017336]QKE75844.1 YjcZ family sporulation protein [Arthrobacter citreus]